MSRSNILFQLSGSIAGYKACQVISHLVQQGHAVKVVASQSALQFVGKATLEGLTAQPVLESTFEPGRMMDHIELARWADLAILCPASANSINKLSQGLADDIIGSLFLAFEQNKPYLIAPAMNSKMLAHPATQESLTRLQGWGVQVLPCDEGHLACGEVGSGRLLDPKEILHHIERALSPLQSKDLHLNQPKASWPRKILITSGGTREFIDGVRYIGNISSGRTGAFLADFFHQNNWDVLHLRAASAASAKQPVTAKIFVSFSDLDQALTKNLSEQEFDAVIHLAAVSDYSIDEISSGSQKISADLNGKIDSGEELSLRLKKNHKILDRLKSVSANREIKVIGFKLTNTKDSQKKSEAVKRLFSSQRVDAVVHNDLSELSPDHPEKHPAVIYTASGPMAACSSKHEMAQSLLEFLSTPSAPIHSKPVSDHTSEVEL